eukprot:6476653-Amphidinium_carterae.1
MAQMFVLGEELPVGRGALHATCDLAHTAEEACTIREQCAAMLLDWSTCYERVDLNKFKGAGCASRKSQSGLSIISGLQGNMHQGRRRVLLNGALSELVATLGIPASWGPGALGMRTLSAGAQMYARVLLARGCAWAGDLMLQELRKVH